VIECEVQGGAINDMISCLDPIMQC